MSMLSIQIDEKAVEEIYLEEIKKRLEEKENDIVNFRARENFYFRFGSSERPTR